MARPEKGTPEWDLWIAAIEVATDPPWKPGTSVSRAGVYWPKLQALRDALEACGIDWRAVKEQEAPRPMRRARRDEKGTT